MSRMLVIQVATLVKHPLFPVRSDNDTKGAVMGWHGVPMFHGMGSFMCWAAVCTPIPRACSIGIDPPSAHERSHRCGVQTHLSADRAYP